MIPSAVAQASSSHLPATSNTSCLTFPVKRTFSEFTNVAVNKKQNKDIKVCAPDQVNTDLPNAVKRDSVVDR